MSDSALPSKLKLRATELVRKLVKKPSKKDVEKKPAEISNGTMPKTQLVNATTAKSAKNNLEKTPWNAVEPKTPRKPVQRYDQVHYASKFLVSRKVFKKYKYVSEALAILRGKLSQNSKKFNYVSNGKQSSFISVMVLVKSCLESCENWDPQSVDNLIDIGDMNFRKRCKKFPPNQIITPMDLSSQMFLDEITVKTRVGQRSFKGILKYDNSELLAKLKFFLKDCSRVVVNFGAKNFAIWEENMAFYLFNSEDTKENGEPTDKFKGAACIVRTKDLDSLIDYMRFCLKFKANAYTLCSFKLESPKKQSLCTIEELPEQEAIMEKISSIDFSDSFKFILDTQGLLMCNEFLKEKDSRKAPYIACSALAMLSILKSSSWEPKTISDVFKIGLKMFTESSKKVKDNKLSITEQKLHFDFGENSLQISAENIVCGSLTFKKEGDISLVEGLKFFFEAFECGIIQGPETVAVWQESGIFYLMDPYQCNRQLRATRRKVDGNSALNWFNDIESLVKHYLANVMKSKHTSPYKICLVEMSKGEQSRESEVAEAPVASCSKGFLSISEMSQHLITTLLPSNRLHEDHRADGKDLADQTSLLSECDSLLGKEKDASASASTSNFNNSPAVLIEQVGDGIRAHSSKTANAAPKPSKIPPKTSHLPQKPSKIPSMSSKIPSKSSKIPPKTSNVAPKPSKIPPKTSKIPPKTANVAPKPSKIPPKTSKVPPKTSIAPPKVIKPEIKPKIKSEPIPKPKPKPPKTPIEKTAKFVKNLFVQEKKFMF